MALKNDSLLQPVDSVSLSKRMLHGALIGLALISFFLLTAGRESAPEWGPYWRIRPLIVVPVAGAMAGLFYYFMGYMRAQDGFVKILGYILSILGYIVALWLGTVAGLDGTYWN